MCVILQKNLGYTLNEAGMLMSAAGNLQFCQVVDPERTVRMAMPKTICDKVLLNSQTKLNLTKAMCNEQQRHY